MKIIYSVKYHADLHLILFKAATIVFCDLVNLSRNVISSGALPNILIKHSENKCKGSCLDEAESHSQALDELLLFACITAYCKRRKFRYLYT